VGRIETAGQTLVDLHEAMELLGKSRATVFRMMTADILIRVPVRGVRTPYITLDSIERSKNPTPEFLATQTDNHYPLKTLSQELAAQQEVQKRFGHILTSRPSLPQLSLPFLDPTPSSAE
jgi:hypothetical protein